MKKLKFEPREIGQIDDKRAWEIKQHYSKLCESLTLSYSWLNDLFGEFSAESLINLVKHPMPEKKVIALYVQIKKPEYGEFDLGKLISNDLVVTPEPVQFFIQELPKILEMFGKIREEGFYYPLIKLYDKEESIFITNDDFRKKLQEKLSSVTRSIRQNELLHDFETLRDTLNNLHREGIFNFSSHGPLSLGVMGFYFEKTKNGDPGQPLELKRNIFNLGKLRKFQVGRRFDGVVPFDILFHLNGHDKDDQQQVQPQQTKQEEPQQELPQQPETFWAYSLLEPNKYVELKKIGEQYFLAEQVDDDGKPVSTAQPFKKEPYHKLYNEKIPETIRAR